MITYTDYKLHDELDASSLPPKLKEAIKSLPVASMLAEIGMEHELILGEVAELYDEVCKVLLGKVSAKELGPSLRLKISTERHPNLDKVIGDINAKIFLKVRSLMQEGGEKTGTSPTPTAPVPRPEAPRKQAYKEMGVYIPKKSVPPPTNLPGIDQQPPLPTRQTLLRQIENPSSEAHKADTIPNPVSTPPKESAVAVAAPIAPPAPAKIPLPPPPPKPLPTPPPPPRPTAVTAPAPTTAPQQYTTDPYREPLQ